MKDHIRIKEITEDTALTQAVVNQSAEEWRGILTAKQHIEREINLDHILADEGMSMRRWAIERLSSQGWEIVSSMEALERAAYVKIKGERIKEVHSYVLDAVYTPEEFRGKGYARILVEEVCQQLADENPKEDTLISLWSDVGDYYSRCGFKPSMRPPVDIVAEYDPAAQWPGPEESCEPLNFEHSRDSVEFVRATMISAIDIMTEKDGQSRVIVAPTAGILKQMQWRTQFICGLLGLEAPDVFGARTPYGAATWTYSLDDRALYILAMSGPILEMVTLFKAALATAKRYEFKVVMYEADLLFVDQPITELFSDSLARAGVNFVHEERKDSLPYFKAAGLHPDMQLEFAGKYSWF